MNPKFEGRFFLGFLAITLAGGWLLSRLLNVVEVPFHPLPLMILCLVAGIGLGYAVLYLSYGPFLATLLGGWTRLDLQLFTRHFQRRTTQAGRPYLETHAGPRLLLRFIGDAHELDKSKENPSRLEGTLSRLMHFESVSLLFHKIPMAHGGYRVGRDDFAGKLMAEVNGCLPRPRQVLAADICLAASPEQIDGLDLYGIQVDERPDPATLYNRFSELDPAAWVAALDLYEGIDLIAGSEHLPHLLTRGRGKPWTVFETAEFFLEPNQGLVGRFEALQHQLGCELLLFIHACVPHPNEVKRAAGVSTISNLAAGWMFRGARKDFDLERLQESLSSYKQHAGGAVHQRPRLVRGLVLLGRKVQRTQFEAVCHHARHEVGMALATLSAASQAKALLTLLPGWESAARRLGRHGPGFNGDPAELRALLGQVTGCWAGDLAQPPYLVLETFDRESVPWSPWQDTAYSTLVAGETGSGKSFLLNLMVLAHVAASPKARTLIIDYGGSFQHLVAALGGRIIDKGALDPETGQPYRFAPLASLGAEVAALGETEREALLEDAAGLTMDLWLYKVNLAHVTPPDEASGYRNAFDHLFKQMVKQAILAFSLEGKPYGACLDRCEAFIGTQRQDLDVRAAPETERALDHLAWMLNAMRALHRSYLSEDARGLNVSEPGALVYFNLDGYPAGEVAELLSLILLNATQLTLQPLGVATLFLVDELKKLAGVRSESAEEVRENLLVRFTEEYLNIVRKYHIAMVLSSQRVHHFSAGMLESTQTHLALIQDMSAAPPQWRITDPDLIRAAKEASPAATVGFSTLALAKKSGAESPVQIGGRLRVPHLLRELFESNKNLKRLADIVARRLGIPTHELVLHTQETGAAYRVPASPAWYTALAQAFPEHAPWLEKAKAVLSEDGMNAGTAQRFLQDTEEV